MLLNKDDEVLHFRFGLGKVLLDNGHTAVIRFEHGIEECEKQSLKKLASVEERLNIETWDIPLEVINRIQAHAILSANSTWGVFSCSRLELLPHQLWVCRQVNQNWPTRWLIAEDVGLGKTIEAGMILSALFSRELVKRCLIICPAYLVEQWQYRLRFMFDLRFTKYTPEADTPRADFWNCHNQIMASLQTLRIDNSGRQNRLIEAEPWDLVIVDEAHHLNADELSGLTLSYKLVKKLQDERRIKSLLFFTGTPHRGKDFGFIALLQLLRPDIFNSKINLAKQLPLLPKVMIRNNKYSVTDLKGNRLFQKPTVNSYIYSYTEKERHFYAQLTSFIQDGLAYATTLASTDRRAVILVLIAIQKLASSSVASIRRALKKRLARIKEGRIRITELNKKRILYEELESLWAIDKLNEIEEELAEAFAELKLMENEEPAIGMLLKFAEQVTEETKIQKIIEIVKNKFPDRQILFFTEYKATQSLLLSELMHEFPEMGVTFINGDEKAEEVKMPNGRIETIYEKRETAANKFNNGKAQYLISTEAGGEGIDLQERCFTLIHVDLPWNPMRLHQRVGRLNRYGQKNQVEVLSFRNPETIESLIWEKLNFKLELITRALSQVMEEPEDLLQMVLGLTSPNFFRELFLEGQNISRETLSRWFDEKTAQFGGQQAIETVKNLVGNVKKFDFQAAAGNIPQVELIDLEPFFRTALFLNNRNIKEDEKGISFKTPEAWQDEPGILYEYKNMHFDRQDRSEDGVRRLLGVGHKVMNKALNESKARRASIASLPNDILKDSLFIFRIFDRVTEKETAVQSIVVALELSNDTEFRIFKDWEIIKKLNQIPLRKNILKQVSSRAKILNDKECLNEAKKYLEQNINKLA